VIIIPDKQLARVPFGALPLTDGRYAVNEFEMQFAPSASAFLAMTAKANAAPATDEKLLAVGDPPLDRTRYPSLGPLPGAEREIREASANYDAPVTVSANAISKGLVLEELGRADVFHFAGHYVYDGRSPSASGLLLGAGDDGLLTNPEIAAHDLSRLRLVVLSACRTGSEQVLGGEGMLGAARTFLGAGIPLVVASQWEVDSTATAELMVRFHKFRKADGLSTTRALRRAQLSMLEHPRYRDPFYWAPFIAYGAYVDY
jgi:CHAT domain-containing protein